MSRPDFGRVQRQTRDIGQFVGETATWRKFVSAAGGNPAYGEGETEYYVERRVTGLFKPVEFEEIAAAGGQFVSGDVMATVLDCQPGSRDEFIWRGTIYRAESDPVPQRIVGSSAYRLLLRRGEATG